MKKFFITVLAALFVSGAFAQDTAFPDIPANHWAGDAVSRIADLGIVIGFPDGTFRGNEAFTRYQAALVISRLLDVLNDNIDSAMAMTQEDLASLRNAVQELASDVAAQGVRLAAAESAVSSLSDDVTANTSRLDELEAMMADMGTGEIDPEVLRDLQNQIASLRVAADTAQAQAEAAEARANQALALAEDNAGQISALASVVANLQSQVDALGSLAGSGEVDFSGIQGQIDRNANDIANIREFVILLRRDQVALRDRVAALEESDAEQSAAIADLQERVTAIEENPLGITGDVTIEYDVVRFSGTPFDIDRAYGQGLVRERSSFFSTGESDDGEDDEETLADFTTAVEGDVSVSPDFEFNFAPEFTGTGPLGTESFSVVVSLTIDEVNLTDPTVDTDTQFLIALDDIEVNYDPIGGDPLTFEFGEDLDETFTGYILNTEDIGVNEGFVLTIGSPDFLSFLDPTLTVLYATDGSAGTDTYLRGLRTTVAPLDGFALGFSYVQLAENAGDFGDELGDNVETSVWGIDAAASVSIIDLAAEYASSTAAGSPTALFVMADLNIAELGVPILEEIRVNYRDIADGWFDGAPNGFGLATDEGDAEFDDDQTGFGVEADLDIFGLLALEVFYDSYSITDPAATDVSAFGVDATVDLPLAFNLTAFYQSVSVNGAVADGTDEAGVERDNDYETGYGVGLEHVGSADDALIDNLDLLVEYGMFGADYDISRLNVEADYVLDISVVELTPFVGYETENDPDADSDDTTTITAATGLSIDLTNVFLEPTLNANVNYRSTAHTDVGGGVADYTADVLQFSVGVELGAFLFENSELSVDYASFTGTNIVANPGAITDAPTGVTASVSGYEVVWDYSGLEVAYGVYNADPNTAVAGDDSNAQAFSIAYTVTF